MKDKTATPKKINTGSKKGERKIFISKLVVVLMLIALQVVLIFLAYGAMREYIIYWRTGAMLLSLFVVLYLVNKQDNPAYKLIWIMLVLTMPLAGGALYIAMAGNRTRVKFIKEALDNHNDTFRNFDSDEEIWREINEKSKSASVQSKYISKTAGYPVYRDTEVEYFSVGERNYDALKRELLAAKSFIFMEYFIIKQGEMWNSILDILVNKVREGVDVRLIYDDFGCAMGVPSRFKERMEKLGIKVAPFNPVVPIISLRQNNRDHRKITVIDGWVGFTGGINLADEYINREERFGHWKDTGVMLKGRAVWNLTVMFLQNWQFLTKEADDYNLFRPDRYLPDNIKGSGYVQPYGDTPVDNEIVGENIYLNMINKAKYYVYITTPYLIIDNEMVTALTLAAKSGIDVRIITPGIPDKKLVYLVTQSYYAQLVSAGVKIYQYTPGFIHAKTVIVDGRIATVGTINFDYRSLYLHFECGVWMYDAKVIEEIVQDYKDTLEVCDEVTMEEIRKYSGKKRLWQSVLRLVAPLL